MTSYLIAVIVENIAVAVYIVGAAMLAKNVKKEVKLCVKI